MSGGLPIASLLVAPERRNDIIRPYIPSGRMVALLGTRSQTGKTTAAGGIIAVA